MTFPFLCHPNSAKNGKVEEFGLENRHSNYMLGCLNHARNHPQYPSTCAANKA